jgi:CRP-like cAMP-binding protein
VITDLECHLAGEPPVWSKAIVAETPAEVRPARVSKVSSVLADPILKSVIVDSKGLTEALEFPADRVVFFEGDTSQDVYLLISGEVEVLKAGISIAVLNQVGTFFGEMSGLLGVPRSSTVRTRTDTQVVRIDQKTFENFLNTFPSLNYRLAVMLAERLNRTTGRYYQIRTRFRQLQRHLNAVQGLLGDDA